MNKTNHMGTDTIEQGLAAIEEHQVGDLVYGAAGQSVAWCNEETTVDEIMSRLVTETETTLHGLPR